MVNHLRRETPLAVEYERYGEKQFQQQADESAFMEMGVNEVRPEAPRSPERRKKEQDVKIGLVPGRAGGKFPVPGNERSADDFDAGDVTAQVIGDDSDLIPQLGESPRFRESVQLGCRFLRIAAVLETAPSGQISLRAPNGRNCVKDPQIATELGARPTRLELVTFGFVDRALDPDEPHGYAVYGLASAAM